jgi:hypothetical protein
MADDVLRSEAAGVIMTCAQTALLRTVFNVLYGDACSSTASLAVISEDENE